MSLMFEHRESTDYSSLNTIVPANITTTATNGFKVPIVARWVKTDPEDPHEMPTAAIISIWKESDAGDPEPSEDVVISTFHSLTPIAVKVIDVSRFVQSQDGPNTMRVRIDFDTNFLSSGDAPSSIILKADGIDVVNSSADDTGVTVITGESVDHTTIIFSFTDWTARLGKIVAATLLTVDVLF